MIIFTEELGTYKNTEALRELGILAIYCADLKHKITCETKGVSLLWCVTSQLPQDKSRCFFPPRRIWNNYSDLTTVQ